MVESENPGGLGFWSLRNGEKGERDQRGESGRFVMRVRLQKHGQKGVERRPSIDGLWPAA